MIFIMLNSSLSCDFKLISVSRFYVNLLFPYQDTHFVMSQFSCFFLSFIQSTELIFHQRYLMSHEMHILHTELNSSHIVSTVFLLFILFAASFCVWCIWGTSKLNNNMANQMNVWLIEGMNHQFMWNNCLELVFACQKCAHLQLLAL